jgi:hypothetical protein
MAKSEIRNPRSETNSNDRNSKRKAAGEGTVSVLGILNIVFCFEFRAADFEFKNAVILNEF